MGAFVHRLGDIGTGHGCWPPRPVITGSPNVKVNNISVARIGDSYPPHCCCSIPESHGAVQAVGSPTVKANGIPISRIGDSISCGGSALGCSSNVKA